MEGKKNETHVALRLLCIALAHTTSTLLKAHALHALLKSLLLAWGPSYLKLAQRNAAVLVLGGHFLPFFNPWYSRSPDCTLRIGDWCVCCHVANLDKRDWNQAGTA